MRGTMSCTVGAWVALLASDLCCAQSTQRGAYYGDGDSQCSGSASGDFEYKHIGGLCYQVLNSGCASGDVTCHRSFITVCGVGDEMIDIEFIDDECGEGFDSKQGFYQQLQDDVFSNLSMPTLHKHTYSWSDHSTGACTAYKSSDGKIKPFKLITTGAALDAPNCKKASDAEQIVYMTTSYNTTSCDDELRHVFSKQVAGNCWQGVSAKGTEAVSSFTVTCDITGDTTTQYYASTNCSGSKVADSEWVSTNYPPASDGACTSVTRTKGTSQSLGQRIYPTPPATLDCPASTAAKTPMALLLAAFAALRVAFPIV
eukprot:gb/GFBE01042655.1/.p1 GENE.gb/GFBE01042655.1/~~gb/GFBE01042655.1/.p1  ORF type:complete len:314 (+),score=63.81 gb/GFBE01042655.1/:1-942(+)